jgi:hypothetical protein
MGRAGQAPSGARADARTPSRHHTSSMSLVVVRNPALRYTGLPSSVARSQIRRAAFPLAKWDQNGNGGRATGRSLLALAIVGLASAGAGKSYRPFAPRPSPFASRSGLTLSVTSRKVPNVSPVPM